MCKRPGYGRWGCSPPRPHAPAANRGIRPRRSRWTRQPAASLCRPDRSTPERRPGAVTGADLVFVDVDQGIQRGRIDQALFHQQGFQRLDPQRDGGGNFLAIIVVLMGVMVVWIAAHALDPPRISYRLTISQSPTNSRGNKPIPALLRARLGGGRSDRLQLCQRNSCAFRCEPWLSLTLTSAGPGKFIASSSAPRRSFGSST